jgi:K+-transporting ATPase c subunit
LQFDGERVVGSTLIGEEFHSQEERADHERMLAHRLQAAVQQYTHHMVNGTLTHTSAAE